MTFKDELRTYTITWRDQHLSILFNVFLHNLKGDSYYNWFQDVDNSGKPTTAEQIIVDSLDAALAELGARPWDISRAQIEYTHDIMGALASTPFAQRSTYAQCVEMGRRGPVRIESMFPLGESGNILMDKNGDPIFDAHFFDMLPLYNNYLHRPFPLFHDE